MKSNGWIQTQVEHSSERDPIPVYICFSLFSFCSPYELNCWEMGLVSLEKPYPCASSLPI